MSGPAPWSAAVGAAIVIYWANQTELLSLWATLPFAFAYPLFVFTAEGRRCRELLGGLDAALQFALGMTVAALWALVPALASVALFDAALSIYTYLPSENLLQLLLVCFVFVPLLFGLVFRYVELWLGSSWALVAVTAIYVADAFHPWREVWIEGVAWPAPDRPRLRDVIPSHPASLAAHRTAHGRGPLLHHRPPLHSGHCARSHTLVARLR